MTSNTEYIRRALREVALRRQVAMTKAEQARQRALVVVPELSRLENERRLAGIAATRLAVQGAGREQIDAALEKTRTISREYDRVLRESGYEQAASPHFTCKKCEDKGRLPNGQICECVRDLVRTMRREEVNQSSPLELSSFDTFSLEKYPETFDADLGCTVREHMRQLTEYAYRWAENFTLSNPSLYLCGYAGLGKTHLALAMARIVLEKGYQVVYVSAQNAFDAVEKEHFSNDGDTMTTLCDAELLILDDLGTEFISPYVTSCLYSLINTRVCRRLPTIYTSNIIDDKDLQRRYTEKIVSRLLGSCETLYFCGQDIRLEEK
ncbi:MAG TPA: ATP-binding protein [Candidatus Ruthenibacterium merdavium]|uniref:ATP-binding protein n=1 Tax=Candidatus Ruthenibacterium merdavium TaxID=2838752 RepID=A0A9D2Q6N6_9FIRM|nr:ATP-binding protein [Candidatus Ruthenibacterium merdavium]